MTKPEDQSGENQPVSKVKLAIGAASLFLFIIGVKRTFKMENAAEVAEPTRATQRPRDGRDRRKTSGKRQRA